MKRFCNKMWNKLKRSSQGAALLMVLLVTVFVILTGSSVMFTSYNGYIMKLMEREGAKTFYTTEEIVDLVRIEYQEAASSALQDAYTKVMAEYSFIVVQYKEEAAIQEEAQIRFNQYFIEALTGSYSSTDPGLFTLTPSTNTSTNPLYYDLKEGKDINGTYHTVELGNELAANGIGYVEDFSSNSGDYGIKGGVGITGTGGHSSSVGANDGTFVFTYGDNGYPRLVLENITVSYVSDSPDRSNAYQTNVTTDIVIEMPMFTHTGEINLGNEGNEGLPFENVATLGKYWVKVSKQSTNLAEILVTGDVYGGVFFTYNENFSLGGEYANNSEYIIFSHADGRLITFNGTILAQDANNSFVSGTLVDRFRTDNLGREIHEGVEVYDGTNFIMANNTELWTKSVYVDAGSNLTLDGVTFVEGDITIDGGEARYTNSMFHYTASKVKLAGDITLFGNGSTAETSSAIIIDGPDVVLDMSELDQIYLAGSAYLTPGRLNVFESTHAVGSAEYNAELAAYNLANESASYDLGQSLSTLPDQIAYLIPPAALSNDTYSIQSNPIMVETETNLFETTKVNAAYGILNGKISDYAKGEPHIISRTYGNYILYYFFYDFHDSAAQAKYLKDYVDYNDDFQTNLELFVDMSDTKGDYLLPSVESATGGLRNNGSFYYLDSSGQLVIEEPDSVTEFMSASYQEDFAKMSITLWKHLIPTNREIVYLKEGVMGGYRDDDNINATLARINPYALQNDWEDMQKLIEAEIKEIKETYNDDQDEYYMRSELTTKYWVRDAYTELKEKESYRSDVVTVDNPFDYYVNLEKLLNDANMQYEELLVDSDGTPAYKSDKTDELLGKLPTGTAGTRAPLNEFHMYFYFDSDEERKHPVAVFSVGGFNFSGVDQKMLYDEYDNSIRHEDLCMILAVNGVNMYDEYEGLVMSNTGIGVMAPITSNPVLINEAIYAKNDFGIPLKDYLRNMIFASEGETPGTSSNNAEVNWAPNDLVYYENWEKH